MSEKRYCLERLRLIDKQGLETWVETSKCSDDVRVLENFLTEGYRIVDMHNNRREVIRKVNMKHWR